MQRDANVVRVGLLVTVALVIFVVTLLLIGERSSLFVPSQTYYVNFETVSGLAEGNPVQLNGVAVGSVDRIVLPQDPGEPLLRVWLRIERRYANRVREDSKARIKTLGLLGDKYVEISSGSASAPAIPAGAEIPAAQPTDVDALIETGEGMVENIVQTASSLANILSRMEAGEGILGELLAPRDDGLKVTDEVVTTLDSIARLTERIERGEGIVGRLVSDRELAEELTATVERVNRVMEQVEGGDGLVGTLLHDAEAKARFDRILVRLDETSAVLQELATELDTGEGLIPRLIHDEELSRTMLEDLGQLLDRLNFAATELTEGDGTAARLLNDPEIYEALNDILVGVEESKLLRWLVRNRQKAGIEVRYEAAQEAEENEAQDP